MFLDRIHRRIAELMDAGCIETGDVVLRVPGDVSAARAAALVRALRGVA